MENKAGLITCYVNLDVQTKNIHRTLQFLITNIGNEDIILGYLWLSTFEPQFNWTSTAINENALSVVIRSVNPQVPRREPIIAQLETQEVKTSCQIGATTSINLAIAAQQYTKKAEVSKEY